MMKSRTGLATAFCFLIFCCATFCTTPVVAQPPAPNQMPSVIQVPPEAQATPHFDATAATNAYLAQIPADKTARSDAYFEGGYWMVLWDFLYGIAVALLLLNLRWSARMRDLAE
jgi:STE24 endopeptidase